MKRLTPIVIAVVAFGAPLLLRELIGVETLKGKGPFTVFAPTDAAFAKLPEGTVEALLQPTNRERLSRVLTYHVIPGP